MCISLLGNDPPTCLPAVELDFGERRHRLVSWADKFHRSFDEPQRVCPAPLDASMTERLNAMARATFGACHARDYARADIRVDGAGQPYVLEINSMASLGPGGSMVCAARAAGESFVTLVGRIVHVAYQRYFGMQTRPPAAEVRATLPPAGEIRALGP